VIDHLSLSVTDLVAAGTFYDAVLGALGHGRVVTSERHIGYGTRKHADLDEGAYISLVLKPKASDDGSHVAFLAPNRAAVDTFHTAALANGGTDDGGPGPRPDYHTHYYAAFVRDPFGNRIEAVCHAAE